MNSLAQADGGPEKDRLYEEDQGNFVRPGHRYLKIISGKNLEANNECEDNHKEKTACLQYAD